MGAVLVGSAHIFKQFFHSQLMKLFEEDQELWACGGSMPLGL